VIFGDRCVLLQRTLVHDFGMCQGALHQHDI